MEALTRTLFFIAALVAAGGLCFIGGRRSAQVVCAKNAHTTTDTLWLEVHDTAFIERETRVVRTDTVKLAVANVHENGISWTHQDRYGHGNGGSWTRPDTLYIHDSVYVEVPITQRVFTGDNYVITAEGFRVRLTDVSITYPAVTSTVTSTAAKTKRWSFSVGAQIGYGCTMHGGSPYVGLGVGFGYTF